MAEFTDSQLVVFTRKVRALFGAYSISLYRGGDSHGRAVRFGLVCVSASGCCFSMGIDGAISLDHFH